MHTRKRNEDEKPFHSRGVTKLSANKRAAGVTAGLNTCKK